MTARWIITALASMSLALGSTPAAAGEKRYGLTSFERIVVNGDFVVEVTTRSPVSAVATGGLDALDRLELRSADGTLTINDRRYSSNRARGRSAGAVTIRINAARLSSATVVGAGSLTIDKLAGATVALNLRGPGSLTVKDIAADRLTLAMVGTGKVTLAGRAKTAETRVAGAGLVDATALAITDLTATAEGAGDHRYSAVRTATVTARGVGTVSVAGKPACTVRNLGAGSVTCGQP
jgi:Putative auto-transporter adhesin, head GIN domain